MAMTVESGVNPSRMLRAEAMALGAVDAVDAQIERLRQGAHACSEAVAMMVAAWGLLVEQHTLDQDDRVSARPGRKGSAPHGGG